MLFILTLVLLSFRPLPERGMKSLPSLVAFFHHQQLNDSLNSLRVGEIIRAVSDRLAAADFDRVFSVRANVARESDLCAAPDEGPITMIET